MIEDILHKYEFNKLNEFLESIKEKIVDHDIKIEVDNYINSKWVTINTRLINGIDLKILISESKEYNIVSFYFNKDKFYLEQVEFMMLCNSEYDFNKIIKHNYFTVNDEIATTFNSAHWFSDNYYKSGWEEIRRVYFKDICHYAGRDNLANFSSNIDDSKKEILYKKSNDILEEKPIISVMAFEKEEYVSKVLTKLKK